MKLNRFIPVISLVAVLFLASCAGAGTQSAPQSSAASSQAVSEAESASVSVESTASSSQAVSEAESASVSEDSTASSSQTVSEEKSDSSASSSQADNEDETSKTVPDADFGITAITKYGNIVLNTTPEDMTKLGYEPGDVIDVRIGDETVNMPIGSAFSDVDNGDPVCCFRTNSEGEEQVALAINSGDLATSMGIADIEPIEDDPGFEVIWRDGFDESTKVYISMAKKQGYAEEYKMHQLTGTRSDKREDYPDLSDAEFANYREINTKGMGKGALYRSSSPVDPSIGRNKEADAQIPSGNIKTILNMTDQESMLEEYPDYDQTNYSKCDVIALDMDMDFLAEDFSQKLTEGLRYMLDHDGPYLIHCKEGKDRTGFLAGILEAFMGADIDEITKDYMTTYFNYYGITPDSPQYAEIADGNIKKSLAKAFGVDNIEDAGTDLSSYAADYFKKIGLSDDEISGLKDRLGKDYKE